MASRRRNLLLPIFVFVSFSFCYPYLIVIPVLDSCASQCMLSMHAHFSDVGLCNVCASAVWASFAPIPFKFASFFPTFSPSLSLALRYECLRRKSFCSFPLWLEVTCTSFDVQIFALLLLLLSHVYFIPCSSVTATHLVSIYRSAVGRMRNNTFTKTTINSLNAAMPVISINLSFVDALCYKLRDGERDTANTERYTESKRVLACICNFGWYHLSIRAIFSSIFIYYVSWAEAKSRECQESCVQHIDFQRILVENSTILFLSNWKVSNLRMLGAKPRERFQTKESTEKINTKNPNWIILQCQIFKIFTVFILRNWTHPNSSEIRKKLVLFFS